jgi:hypothetical protein
VGLRIGAVILPYAHAAVDVDSLSDYVLVQRYGKEAAARRSEPESGAG